MDDQTAIQSILDIAVSHAKESNAKRITDIHLVIGELSTRVDQSVQFYWDILSKGTLAEGARLHFRLVPAELQCMVCFEKYHPTSGILACPHCGSVGAKIIAGEEFSVDKIDLED
jgi:hydrogenase nickel incorporation protein HypA/HybF